jgi:hypothetical protein
MPTIRQRFPHHRTAPGTEGSMTSNVVSARASASPPTNSSHQIAMEIIIHNRSVCYV